MNYNPQTDLQYRMQLILDFLLQPLVRTLFEIHPNQLGTSSFEIPKEWRSWSDWAGSESAEVDSERNKQKTEAPWILLLRHSSRSGQSSVADEDIPLELRSLIEDASCRVIPRDIGLAFPHVEHQLDSSFARGVSDAATCPQHSSGMSPKKTHEVVEMSSFIRRYLSSTQRSSAIDMKHVVDIGAGQAYLSRALRDQLGLHVLALDWSDVQTRGAARKEETKTSRRSKRAGIGNVQCPQSPEETSETRHSELASAAGSLTYVTTTIDQASLLSSTSAWISGRDATDSETIPPMPTPVADAPAAASPSPVLFVALHACGSLTPDILLAFVAARKAGARAAPWTPHGAVVVGCCYNMLRPEDFPLSRAFRACRNAAGFVLTASHLQLAAQVPGEWLRSEESRRAATLALRKVVWRALLEDVLRGHLASGEDGHGDAATVKGSGASSTASDAGGRAGTAAGEEQEEEQAGRRPRRLGRLRDTAYADWETFVGAVRAKLGIDIEGLDVPRADAALERRIEVFHTLRCLLGPVVESLILLDRLAWVQEELEGLPFDAKLVNLFDQASGSGRNVAIVITVSEDACA